MIDVKPHIAAGAKVRSLEEYRELYRRSVERPEEFWREQAGRLDWFVEPRQVLDDDADQVDFSWYAGGRLNAAYNCVDRHLAERGDQTAIIWVGDEPGEYRAITYRELKHQVARVANVLRAHGVRKGDRVCIYMPMIPEIVYAMLACARIGAVHSVVFGGFSADSLRDRILDAGCQRRGHRQRGPARRQDASRSRRPSTARSRARRSSSACSSPGAPTPRCRCTPGRDLWLDEETARAALDLPGRVDGRRGPALHPLHLGLDREAQGRAAHDRRLPRLRRAHPRAGLRLPPRRRLLLRRRRRLGHRPQLHRLRPARQRRDHGDVRVDPHLSRRRALLADGRRPRGQHLLHRADRAARHRPPGDEYVKRYKRDQPARPRHRGRADQPRGLAVVPRRRRRGALRGGRHLVADRDRRHHDHAAARRHADQAGLGDAAVLRRASRCWSTRRARSSRATTSPATSASKAPGRARRAPSGATTSASARPTSRSTPASTSPATAAAATRTATTGSPAASTTCSTSPATAWAPPRSRARWWRTRRWRRRRWSASRTTIKGTGIYAYVASQAGLRRARPRGAGAACSRSRCGTAIGADRRPRPHPGRQRPAQDPLRQDHAPHPAQDRRRRVRGAGRHHHPGRSRASSRSWWRTTAKGRRARLGSNQTLAARRRLRPGPRSAAARGGCAMGSAGGVAVRRLRHGPGLDRHARCARRPADGRRAARRAGGSPGRDLVARRAAQAAPLRPDAPARETEAPAEAAVHPAEAPAPAAAPVPRVVEPAPPAAAAPPPRLPEPTPAPPAVSPPRAAPPAAAPPPAPSPVVAPPAFASFAAASPVVASPVAAPRAARPAAAPSGLPTQPPAQPISPPPPPPPVPAVSSRSASAPAPSSGSAPSPSLSPAPSSSSTRSIRGGSARRCVSPSPSPSAPRSSAPARRCAAGRSASPRRSPRLASPSSSPPGSPAPTSTT